ncbi:MAG: cupin domain-containing protein [bacterium]|nr:cupin domain-containing protein [bacterium]
MVKILNTDSVPEDFIDDPGFINAVKTLYLGHCAGSELIYVNIDFVKPGAKSAKYHSHSAQEEFFLVLSGEGTLRFEGEEVPVKEGDFFAKLPGSAHQFINTGGYILKILDLGTRPEVETITYPDESIILLKPERKAYRESDAINGWSSDPNE